MAALYWECVYYSPRILPHTGSFFAPSTPVIYEFQCVNVRDEGCITKGVIDDDDRTTHHQVL
jgi:hypothetical protein